MDIFDHINSERYYKSKRDGIVNGIIDAIHCNSLSKGDRLPSVNKFMQRLGVARMTVVKALTILKERGIIMSEDKVGYFVKDVNGKRELKVLLFLTGFTSYHEIFYGQLIREIEGKNVSVDLYFHHCNPKILKSVLQENLGSYGLYAVTCFDNSAVKTLLSRIPSKKLLQVIRPPILPEVSSIGQDFGQGLKKTLNGLKERLRRYKKFILVFPTGKGHPETIKTVFQEFCGENQIRWGIENKIQENLIEEGIAFWVIEDDDLVSLISLGEGKSFRIGKEIGVLSYNETPLKAIIRNGIATVSVDFADVGRAVGQFVLNPKHTVEVFSPQLILRDSI